MRDTQIRRQDQQPNWKRRKDFLEIAPLSIYERKKPRNFPGPPLLEVGSIHSSASNSLHRRSDPHNGTFRGRSTVKYCRNFVSAKSNRLQPTRNARSASRRAAYFWAAASVSIPFSTSASCFLTTSASAARGANRKYSRRLSAEAANSRFCDSSTPSR